jgi:hypothetical protein
MTIEQKIKRVQKYKTLLQVDSNFLKELQRWYSADLQSHINYLDLIETILYKEFELSRDNKVFLNTLERIGK